MCELRTLDNGEIIEYSAKAINLNPTWIENTCYVEKDGQKVIWNPLKSDSDAFELMYQKDIQIEPFLRENGRQIGYHSFGLKAIYKTDLQRKDKYRYLVALVAAQMYVLQSLA